MWYFLLPNNTGSQALNLTFAVTFPTCKDNDVLQLTSPVWRSLWDTLNVRNYSRKRKAPPDIWVWLFLDLSPWWQLPKSEGKSPWWHNLRHHSRESIKCMYALHTRVFSLLLRDPGSVAASLSYSSPSRFHSLPAVSSCPPFYASIHSDSSPGNSLLSRFLRTSKAKGHRLLCHLNVSLLRVRFTHSSPLGPRFWLLFSSSFLLQSVPLFLQEMWPRSWPASYLSASLCCALWLAVCLPAIMADRVWSRSKT